MCLYLFFILKIMKTYVTSLKKLSKLTMKKTLTFSKPILELNIQSRSDRIERLQCLVPILLIYKGILFNLNQDSQRSSDTRH